MQGLVNSFPKLLILIRNTLFKLYFNFRSFRSIGDETFLRAFEDTTLPFEDWTHEAHMRMAWNYLREFDIDKAESLIK